MQIKDMMHIFCTYTKNGLEKTHMKLLQIKIFKKVEQILLNINRNQK